MEAPTQYYSVSIPKTRRHSTTKIFKSHYTVSATQVYEVRLNLLSDFHIALKRYSEFLILKSSVCDKQVDAKTLLPLPDFPSKKLISLNSKVVEIRREMLETWLSAVIQQEQLLPLVFKFLDLSLSRMSFVMNMINSASAPVDDAIVLDLAAQLTSEVRQKLKALDNFDRVFFERRRKLSETSLQTVLAHLLPLCADTIVGAKSIYIVSKLISPQHNRGYELFLHCFVRENTELLASMDLHKHICQEFPGDTAQFAFEIMLVLYEYYERTCQAHFLSEVLQYNIKAMETFNNRKVGEFDVKEVRSLKPKSDWISLDDEQFPSINFRYKIEEGTSIFNGSMVVNASVENLLTVLVSMEARREWDMFFDGGKVLQKLSDSEFTVMFRMNFEYNKVCYTLKCTVSRYSPTSVAFALEAVDLPDVVLPPGYKLETGCKSIYTIETLSHDHDTLVKSTMSTTPTMSDNEQEQDDSEAAAYSDSELIGAHRCIMTYELQQTKNTLAYTTASLEGRLILVSWSRLKAIVENHDVVMPRGSISNDTLQDIVQRKKLKTSLPKPRVPDQVVN